MSMVSLACEEEMVGEPESYECDSMSLNRFTLSRDDVAERIELMVHMERFYTANPRYMEEIQAVRLRVQWRSKVAEWLMAFPDEFKMSTETVAIALNLMDRYLSIVPSNTRMLEILAMVSIFVASKINESIPIKMAELQSLASGKFSVEHFKLMELELFRVLDWKLNPVTPHAYIPVLLHELKHLEQKEISQCADLFLDVAVCEYRMLEYTPSVIALSSIFCAYNYIGQPFTNWLQSLETLSLSIKVQSPEVQDCSSELMRIFSTQYPDLLPPGSQGRCISPVSVMETQLLGPRNAPSSVPVKAHREGNELVSIKNDEPQQQQKSSAFVPQQQRGCAVSLAKVESGLETPLAIDLL